MAARQAPRRARALALAVLVTGLAGCGGGGGHSTTTPTVRSTPTSTSTRTTTVRSRPAPLGRARYDARMKLIQTELSDDLAPLQVATSATEAGRSLDAARYNLATVELQLRAVVPPRAVARQQAALVAGVSEFIAELGPVVAKLQRGNIEALTSLDSLPGVLAIQAAAEAIRKAGYAIG